MSFERLCLNRTVDRWQELSTAGNLEGRFGKPVGRVAGVAAKSARTESRDETLERLPANRLRPVVSHIPTAQVERRTLFYSDSAHAQVVSKVRSAAVCYLVFRDAFQP